MIRVKICGLRDLASARVAVEAGADLVGFVFAPTRRYVAPELVAAIRRALPRSVGAVGLFVNHDAPTIRSIVQQCRLDFAQLCGEETPAFCRELGVPVVKSLRIREPGDLAALDDYAAVTEWCVLDGFQPGHYGGTGTTFDWHLAAEAARHFRIMLAGGLTPENVATAVEIARPWGVDVSSGVETDGQKDPAKITAFVAAARQSPGAAKGG